MLMKLTPGVNIAPLNSIAPTHRKQFSYHTKWVHPDVIAHFDGQRLLGT